MVQVRGKVSTRTSACAKGQLGGKLSDYLTKKIVIYAKTELKIHSRRQRHGIGSWSSDQKPLHQSEAIVVGVALHRR
jgi:hypothetical protein